MNIPFEATLPIAVAGPTNSGKTFWVKELLKTKTAFTKPVKSILYCYGVDQPTFKDMRNEIKIPIQFLEGIPTLNDLEDLKDGDFHVIILDDLMEQIVNDELVEKLFTKYCHHYNMTAIFITQNIFAQGRRARNISLQMHYYILFANNRDKSQIATFARQVARDDKEAYIEAFTDATKRKYGYLCTNCTHYCESEIFWSTNILPNEAPMYAYIPKISK